MSRITDAIDGAGDTPLRIPERFAGVVGSSSDRRERAEAALRAGGSLADAVADALSDLATIEVVGFAAVDAEPFAVAIGAPEQVVAALRRRLAHSAPVPGVVDVVWAGHRGHVAWLHPAALASSQLLLALRIAEELDPARALGSNAPELVRVATAALADESELAARLEGASLDALVGAVTDRATPPSAAQPDVRDAVVVFGSDGSAVVARAAGGQAAFGLVERGGRPWLLPLHGTDVAGWLTRLHVAIDRDGTPADVLDAGAVIEGDATPTLLAGEACSALVAPATATFA